MPQFDKSTRQIVKAIQEQADKLQKHWPQAPDWREYRMRDIRAGRCDSVFSREARVTFKSWFDEHWDALEPHLPDDINNRGTWASMLNENRRVDASNRLVGKRNQVIDHMLNDHLSKLRMTCLSVIARCEAAACVAPSGNGRKGGKTGGQNAQRPNEDVTPEKQPTGLETTRAPAAKDNPVTGLSDLIDPIIVGDVAGVVGTAAGRKDKLSPKMRRHGFQIVKIANKNRCQRADAIVMFPKYRSKIEEI